jgi:hypothetical protein
MSRASDYQVFGLRIRSEIRLPELFPASGAGDPDVTIRCGSIPGGATAKHIEGDGDSLILNISDVARFRIDGGRNILVDPAPGVPERNIRLFLLGSTFGALLHQRGLLPLHSNAIELDGRAVAFMGESGAGKSTLAAWFHDRGHRIVADDVCVVRFLADGRAVTVPGLPRLRLWQEALEATGREAGNFQRSYVGDDDWNKFDVPITRQTAASAELGLSAIYVLEQGNAFEIRRIEGLAAAEAIFAHTYRGAYVSAVKGEHSHWSACMRLIRNTPVYCLTRRWGLDNMEEQGRRLLDHAKAATANSASG